MTVVADLDKSKVMYVADGKSSAAVTQFVESFQRHNGDPWDIETVTCDMSLDYRSAINRNFLRTQTVIDNFYVVKHANDAFDETREDEVARNAELKKTRYFGSETKRPCPTASTRTSRS